MLVRVEGPAAASCAAAGGVQQSQKDAPVLRKRSEKRRLDRSFWDTGSGALHLPPGPLQGRAKVAVDLKQFSGAWKARDSGSCLDQITQLVAALDADETSTEGNAPSAQPSAAARAYLGGVMQGRHAAFLRSLVEDGNAAGALQYAAMSFDMAGQRKAFDVVLKACLNCGSAADIKLAMEAFAAVQITPDAHNFATLLTAAGRNGDAKRVRDLFHSACAAGECTVVVCNSAIQASATCCTAEVAFEVWAHMQRSGVPADARTFSGLVTAARWQPSRMGEVVTQYARLLREEPWLLDHHVFSALFTTAHRCRHRDAAWLLQVFQDLERLGLSSNNMVVASFLQACWDSPMTAQQEALVLSQIAARRRQHRFNSFVFTALLTFCTRHGMPERVIEVWAARHEDGVPADEHLYSALFRACSKGATPELADLAAAQELHLHRLWHHAKKGQRPSTTRNVRIAYNCLLDVYAETGRVEAAQTLFEALRRDGPAPCTACYNSFIRAHANERLREQVGDTEAAFAGLREMGARGVRADEATYGALVHGCAQLGLVRTTLRLLDQMRAAGLAPSVKIYTSIMDACVKKGQPDTLHRAFQVLEDMQGAGLQPNEVTYGCLLNACHKLGDADRALEVYQRACAAAVPPSDLSHDVLIKTCAVAGRVEEALDVVKDVARKHGALRAGTLNSVVRALAESRAGGVLRALRMLSLMRTWGMRPTIATLNTLVGAAARTSHSEAAATLYWELRATGATISRAAGSDLIIALCRASQPRHALRVYEDMVSATWGRTSAPVPPVTPQRVALAQPLHSPQPGSAPAEALVEAPKEAPVEALAGAQQPGRHEAAALKLEALDDSAPPAADLGRLMGGTIGAAGHAASCEELSAHQGSQRLADAGPAVGASEAQLDQTLAPISIRLQPKLADEGTLDAMLEACAEPAHPQHRALAAALCKPSQRLPENPLPALARPRPPRSAKEPPPAMELNLPPSLATRPPASVHLCDAANSPSGTRASSDPTIDKARPEDAKERLEDSSLQLMECHSAPQGTIPQTPALGALVHAFACIGDLETAFHLYAELRRDTTGASGLMSSNRHMWQALIEACCRQSRIALALQVFDDWTRAISLQQAAGVAPEALPRLSALTLAFLESRCRGDPAYEWRIYDVCAAMRQQSERKTQGALPQAKKVSHHVYDEGRSSSRLRRTPSVDLHS